MISNIYDSSTLSIPQYEVHLLKLGDADCIIVMYQENDNAARRIIVLDAGNVDDWEKIKSFLWWRYQTYQIDVAICTHPDSDHKGGFFGLFADPDIDIRMFCTIDPYLRLRDEDYRCNYTEDQKKSIARRPFNHPTTERNLIDIAERKGVFFSLKEGDNFKHIPLKVVGPSSEYYHNAALGMLEEFKEIVEDPDDTKYDELAELSEDEALSVMDKDNNTSPANQSSIILLFQPTEKIKFLLTGDASCGSLLEAFDKYKNVLQGCILKVPHHGSCHNLTTDLIDKLRPAYAAISAKGSRKHPNAGVVYFLSKYCNVYSTHKGEFYWSSKPTQSKATPLKKKQG